MAQEPRGLLDLAPMSASMAAPGQAPPAQPTTRASLQALLEQLDESQWWPAERLRQAQFEQLQALLRHALKQVPFYRNQWRRAGLKAAQIDGPEQWCRVPILQRAQVQKLDRVLHAKKLPAGHRQPARAQTSGSTGTPISVLTTETTRLLWAAISLRDHAWHARDFSGALASIRIFGDKVDAAAPHGVRIPDWGPPVSLLHASGPGWGLDIHTDPHRQLEWLLEVKPDYLLTFPTNAAALARLCLEGHRKPDNLRELRLVSEAVDTELRTLLQQAFDVPVVDAYSAQEAGYLALQCPDHPHYHVQSENVYLEVVDESGQPCAPGETGRVLITTLHNFAMPLIRYEIGDYATVGAACECGRGLPVLTRILGRVRNMVVLPNGEASWPNLAATFYRQAAPVIQHQVVQHDLEHLEARLVVERALSRDEEAALRNMIVKRIGHPFSVSFSYPERIERSRSGKYEEFVSHVTQERAPA